MVSNAIHFHPPRWANVTSSVSRLQRDAPSPREKGLPRLSLLHWRCCREATDEVPSPEEDCQPACKPGSVHASTFRQKRWMTIHLEHPLPDASRNQPGRRAGKALEAETSVSPLFGFAPGGVCRAAPVASRAVRSCRTVSPLPM